MTTDRELTRIVQSWLNDHEDVLPERFLDELLDQLPATRQNLPLWRAWKRRLVGGTFRLALAGVAVLALAILGYGLFRSVDVGPAATSPVSPTPIPTASPAAEATPADTPVAPTPSLAPAASTPIATPLNEAPGLVAYPVCQQPPGGATACQVWVANSDGTDAHQLIPDEPGPDEPDNQNSYRDQYPLAWSADGTRLLFSFSRMEGDAGILHVGLALTDASGSEPEETEALCPEPPEVVPDLYDCRVPLDHTAIVALSPDANRIAYTVVESWGSGDSEVEATTLVVLDVASASVSRLESTQTVGPANEACTTPSSQGSNASPTWSGDGTRLAFVRSGIGPGTGSGDEALCQNGIFTVDLESGEISQVSLSLEHYIEAVWSTDDSRLLFHASDPTTGSLDVYTIRPDGTDRHALTEDGRSLWPHWTRDGRVAFVRLDATGDSGDTWIADADGNNASSLEETIPALTAAGCVVCPSTTGRLFDRMYWQPILGGKGGQQ